MKDFISTGHHAVALFSFLPGGKEKAAPLEL
jgi:hypothetical protein